jgi:predicted phage terminase large subunit-like protein
LDYSIGVDMAISQKDTADYTAIAVLGLNKIDKRIYILEIYRDRITFNETINKIIQIANKWIELTKNENIPIGLETVGYQKSILQEMIRTTSLNIKGITPTKDKVTRFQILQSRYENGLVYHDMKLSPEFERELLSFPFSRHDDQIDSITHAYHLLHDKVKRKITPFINMSR